VGSLLEVGTGFHPEPLPFLQPDEPFDRLRTGQGQVEQVYGRWGR